MKPWKSFRPRAALWASLALQWGHGDEAVEEMMNAPECVECDLCFNGATAMKPWKRRPIVLQLVKALAASMGPRR